MPRTLRVEYPGAVCRVMDRGDRREDISVNHVDRHDFLKRPAEACQKIGGRVHAYCLMRNHFHLVDSRTVCHSETGQAKVHHI